jgi:AcrR family transcriptional regulator
VRVVHRGIGDAERAHVHYPRSNRMSKRAAKTAATRGRILAAARDLVREGSFYAASMEQLAARAGVTRVTLYRTFGSRQAVVEGLFWEMLAAARLDRIDAAHQLPDVRQAVQGVLHAYAEMFDTLGESMPLALELARSDANMRSIMDVTYQGGRRPDAMARLAGRIVKEGVAADGWTRKQIADSLMVLSSYEAYETLTHLRGYSSTKAADFLVKMASVFLAH